MESAGSMLWARTHMRRRNCNTKLRKSFDQNEKCIWFVITGLFNSILKKLTWACVRWEQASNLTNIKLMIMLKCSQKPPFYSTKISLNAIGMTLIPFSGFHSPIYLRNPWFWIHLWRWVEIYWSVIATHSLLPTW